MNVRADSSRYSRQGINKMSHYRHKDMNRVEDDETRACIGDGDDTVECRPISVCRGHLLSTAVSRSQGKLLAAITKT